MGIPDRPHRLYCRIPASSHCLPNWSEVYWVNSIGRRNTLKEDVAVTDRKRSDQSGRAPLRSPGRPPVAGRDERRRFWTASRRACRVRTLRLRPMCRRLLEQDGSGRQAAAGSPKVASRSNRLPATTQSMSCAESGSLAVRLRRRASPLRTQVADPLLQCQVTAEIEEAVEIQLPGDHA